MEAKRAFRWEFVLVLLLTAPSLYFPFCFFFMRILDETLFDTLFTFPRMFMYHAFPLTLFYLILGPIAAFFLNCFVSMKRKQDWLDRVARRLSIIAIATMVLGAGFWVYFFFGW